MYPLHSCLCLCLARNVWENCLHAHLKVPYNFSARNSFSLQVHSRSISSQYKYKFRLLIPSQRPKTWTWSLRLKMYQLTCPPSAYLWLAPQGAPPWGCWARSRRHWRQGRRWRSWRRAEAVTPALSPPKSSSAQPTRSCSLGRGNYFRRKRKQNWTRW